jgi:hypothetical protein
VEGRILSLRDVSLRDNLMCRSKYVLLEVTSTFHTTFWGCSVQSWSLLTSILFMQRHTFLNKETCSNCDHIGILFITSSNWGVAEYQDSIKTKNLCWVVIREWSCLSFRAIFIPYWILTETTQICSWRHHSRTAVLTDFPKQLVPLMTTILLHRVVMEQRVQNAAEERTWVFRR